MRERVHSLLRGTAGIEHRDVWPIDFVPREAVKVHPERTDVDGAVRCVCDSIDAEHGAGDGVDSVGDGFDIMDGTEDVAGMRAGDQAGALRKQLL